MFKLTTDINLSDKSLFSNDTIIIKFGSENCAPCRSLESKLESISEELKDSISICTVDIDENVDIAMNAMSSGLIHSFMSIPTTFVFKNGSRVGNGIVGDNLQEILTRANS